MSAAFIGRAFFMAIIKLICGLGNPGREHERDRHNAGFWFVQRLAASLGATLRAESKFQGVVAKASAPAGEVWLVMPTTYMNLSGQSVAALARFYKIAPEESLVVHDELDFPAGVVKLKEGGGIAGHNGLKDVASRLASQNFWRLRIGIGHPGDRNRVVDYVLSSPPQSERTLIEQSIERALDVMPLVLDGQMQSAMMKLHANK